MPNAVAVVEPPAFKQPETLNGLLALSPAELEHCDIARMNLLCAEALPGAENMNVEECLATLDQWAQHIKAETDRNHHHFNEDPATYANSEAFYRMLMMAVVLYEDYGVRYNPKLITSPEATAADDHFFADSRDILIHGLVGPQHLGTCSSMPILYIALGRRLDYPYSAGKAYEATCQKTVRVLGGKGELAEDDKSQFNNANIFNFRNLRPGSGIGLIGPIFVLPAFLYGAVRLWRQRYGTRGAARFSGYRDFLLLLLVVAGYAFMCHVLLKWQSIGLWRLMPAFTVLAVPVCGLLLEKRSIRIIALTLAGVGAMVSLAGNLSMMSNRYATDNHNPLQQLLLKLGKQPRVVMEYRWANEVSQKAFRHEPYNNREIALMFLSHAKHPAVIAFAGGSCSDAYYFFGPDLSNRIMPLVDIRYPEQLLEPASNADYLVFPQNSAIDPEKQNVWARQRGYRPFLRVDQQDKCLFLSFEKIP